MNAELEENKELAGNRLSELEELRQDLEEVTTQNEKLKVRHLYLFEDEDGGVGSPLPCCTVSLENLINIILFCICSLAGLYFVQGTIQQVCGT